ncbi:MAG: endonuclease NucS domain-containing protein [Candidatus Nanoarchaeia archaeon]
MKLHLVQENIISALNSAEFVTLFCRCTVAYSGRAESFLDTGDRLLMIKQDKGVLIHQPIGGVPINYLRPPATIDLSIDKNVDGSGVPVLFFNAVSGADEIHVTITHVYDMMIRRLDDGAKQILSGSEAQMSDMLKENPTLIHADFKPLSREEHTKYGFIDVFGHLGDGTLAIVECKRFTAGLSAITQLRRYVEKMQSSKGITTVTGIIAAPAITPNAQAMLDEYGYTFCMVEPPKRNITMKRRQKKIDAFFE